MVFSIVVLLFFMSRSTVLRQLHVAGVVSAFAKWSTGKTTLVISGRRVPFTTKTRLKSYS